jgi:hypothetical protein
VRDGAADDDGMQHAVEVDVVHVAALAAEQAQVLDPFHGPADEGAGVGHVQPSLRA